MTRLIPFCACLLTLAACTAPGSDFEGVPATRVSVKESVFDIRVQGRRAQAIRVNTQYAPRLGPLGARAAYAMQVVSGCTVTRLRGDAAVLIGTLHCAGDAPGAAPQGFPRGTLACYGVDSFESAATGEQISDYDCDWLPDG